MIIKQYYLGCLSQASYLVGDEETGKAAIIDPRRDVDVYLEEARRLGLTIGHVFLTHFHADYISGHLELRERVGAVIHMGARAVADFPFASMADGQSLDLGTVRLEVLETPGHTPESICIVIRDTAADPEKPVAVLTGDTLFVGDVGRPDLMVSSGITAEELAGQLHDSISHKLLALPDETLVYPAHGAGSMCGKNLGSETVTTIGDQRRMNYALQAMDRAEFVRMVTADQPTPPAYFGYDADLNRRERVTLEQNLAKVLVPLTVEEVLDGAAAGAQILDVREPSRFAEGYLRGSINIGLGGTYAIWAGTLLDRVRPVVLVSEPGEEGEAVLRLGRIGFDHVAGYLQGGVASVRERPELLGRTQRMSPASLQAARGTADPPVILDVRTPSERETKRIPGSLHLPLDRFPERGDEVPRDREIVVQCAAGYRSSIGASLLRREGFPRVNDLEGGIEAWEKGALDLERGPSEG